VGLFNRCEAYLRSDSVAIVSLRGTVNQLPSWLENFYSGMVPANGSMKLNDSTTYNYHLANNPNALVHVGSLIGTGFLSRQYEPYLEAPLNRGIRSVIVTGFSQGGALTFLNTSHVYYKYSSSYPGLQVKAYAGAAPKPGNLYYAYDFDHITANGWGYRVVNTADWVPETPVSVQTVNDFVDINPITDAKATINKQKGATRIALKHIYNRMDKASYKAMKTLTKHLGRDVGKQEKRFCRSCKHRHLPTAACT
jgi:predicted lipase